MLTSDQMKNLSFEFKMLLENEEAAFNNKAHLQQLSQIEASLARIENQKVKEKAQKK